MIFLLLFLKKFAQKSDANPAAVADENLSSLNALDRSIRIWDIATGKPTYALHALDYTETIVSLRYGELAVSLDDGWALLQLPAGI